MSSSLANIDPSLLNLWESMEVAMNASTPVSTPRRKRARPSDAEDEQPDDATSNSGSGGVGSGDEVLPARPFFSSMGVTTPAANHNALDVVRRAAAHNRLRSEQLQALEAFALDDLATRQIKHFAQLLAVENKIDKIVLSAPPFQVSESLTKNISSYSLVVLLSSKIAAYKGNTPYTHMINILKRNRFDLPIGIERNHSDWAKVAQCVRYSLTQNRSKIKKAIQASLVRDKETGLQQSIYDLTHGLIANTNCTVNVPLAGRVALMRAEFLHKSNNKFWDSVDARLAELRRLAGNNARKVQKAFDHILSADRINYGEDTYTLDAEGDDLQEEIDNIIGGGSGTGDQDQATPAGVDEARVGTEATGV